MPCGEKTEYMSYLSDAYEINYQSMRILIPLCIYPIGSLGAYAGGGSGDAGESPNGLNATSSREVTSRMCFIRNGTFQLSLELIE